MTAVMLIQGPGAAAELQRLLQGLPGAQPVLPATESALRAALSAHRPGVLLLAGAWASVGGAYATLALADATGAPRKLNVQALAPLLVAPSAAAGPVLPVLLADAPAGAVQVAAAQLRAKGVPAVLVLAPGGADAQLGQAVLTAGLQRWNGGAPLSEVAAALAPAWVAQVHGDGALCGAGAAPLPTAATPLASGPPAAHAAMAAPGSGAAAPAANGAATHTPAAPAAAPPSPAALRVQQRRAAGQFDVFLCHNAADKPAVRALARQLLERGILPWLDEWELPPGQPWQRLLEQQIGRIGAAAVCMGPAGFGRWHEMEMRGFIDEFARRELPVISVLLLPPGAADPSLPLFLRHFTWVDFRHTEPDPMDRLVWGVTGQRPSGLGV